MTQPTPEEIAATEAAALAETEAAAAAAAAAETEGAEVVEGAEALGDKGKQALDRMKATNKALKDQLATYTALGMDPTKLQELIGKSETAAQEAAAAIAKRDAETAALSKANERLVRAEVKAAAATKLANPELAPQLLDMASFDVNDDGDVDSEAITAAIDALIVKYPNLAAQGAKRFTGTNDAGARPGQPAQLTKADISKLTPEQIVEAQKKGLLDDYLAS